MNLYYSEPQDLLRLTFWKHKIHSVTEGESNSVKYKSNQHHLMQQGA